MSGWMCRCREKAEAEARRAFVVAGGSWTDAKEGERKEAEEEEEAVEEAFSVSKGSAAITPTASTQA